MVCGHPIPGIRHLSRIRTFSADTHPAASNVLPELLISAIELILNPGSIQSSKILRNILNVYPKNAEFMETIQFSRFRLEATETIYVS